MMRMLQSIRMLAPLMVLALLAPPLGAAALQFCHDDVPAQVSCKERCSMRHAPRPTPAEPAARQPVAQPCCAPAGEAPAQAPTLLNVTEQLVAAVALLPAEDLAALRVPPRVQRLPDAAPAPPGLRSHLAVSVLLI